MVRAFREILDLNDGELIISPHHASMGAIGAVCYARTNNLIMNHFNGITKLEEYLNGASADFKSLPRLKESKAEYNKAPNKQKGRKKLIKTLKVKVLLATS